MRTGHDAARPGPGATTRRLRPGLRVLDLAEHGVQLGCDPRWAVRLPGLTEAERAGLRALVPGSPVPAAAPGVPADRWDQLLDELTSAGVLVPGRPHRPPLNVGAVDAVAWSLLEPDGDGRPRIERRQQAAVGVLGLGPTGLMLAGALATCGVGALRLEDPTPVRSVDVGPGGYRWSDVGAARQDVAARLLRDVAPHLRSSPAQDDPEVIVVVEGEVADPVRATTLLAYGLPHLSVLVREAEVQVGPLVVPGDGPCLRCLDLHRTDADPAWPALLHRLAAAPANRPGELHVPVLAGVAAHLAAAMVLGLLDGEPRRPGLTWQVPLPDAVPRERVWAPHPRCGCGDDPAQWLFARTEQPDRPG
ncbi:ThiF family adenylyltransferase [Cellulomonas citrea]|uniref:ThiF family adenylyltransferase n=1 Tax=Cellulomonas citrea TaxID=1909423 RepID=UPI00135805B5|nr:ThiF family adenylyltransferase [Cellulomonas citrea]